MIWLISGVVALVATMLIASFKQAPVQQEQHYAKKATAWRQQQKAQQLRQTYPARFCIWQLQQSLAVRPPLWTKREYMRIVAFIKQFEQLTANDHHAELLVEPYMMKLSTLHTQRQKEAFLEQLAICIQAVSLIAALQRHETPQHIPSVLEDVAIIATSHYMKKAPANAEGTEKVDLR